MPDAPDTTGNDDNNAQSKYSIPSEERIQAFGVLTSPVSSAPNTGDAANGDDEGAQGQSNSPSTMDAERACKVLTILALSALYLEDATDEHDDDAGGTLPSLPIPQNHGFTNSPMQHQLHHPHQPSKTRQTAMTMVSTSSPHQPSSNFPSTNEPLVSTAPQQF